MKKIFSCLFFTLLSVNLYSLERDTPVATPWLQEMSQGFLSSFSLDKWIDRITSVLLSPFFIIIFIAILLYIFYRIMKYIDFREKQKKLYVQQLIMFKAKEKGLTNYQIKIFRGVTEILRIEEATDIMDDPLIFEKYIKNFIKYLLETKTGKGTIETICRDIITIYEKIYHGNDIRRPLPSSADLEKNTLLAISSEEGDWYICKMKGVENDSFILYIINTIGTKQIHFTSEEKVNAIFFRGGDAEYRFASVIINNVGSLLKLKFPEKLERGEPVPHLLVNVNLPCEISKPANPGEKWIKIPADLFRLNETEAVIRIDTRLKHDEDIEINFSISDFVIRYATQIISEKHIPETGTYYYNLKFINISDAAKKVIYTFLESILFDV